MAVVATATGATTPAEPNTVTVTGLAAGQQITFMRMTPTTAERIAGVYTADSGGVVAQPDYLYPFDTTVSYVVYDATGTVVQATSNTVGPVPSGDQPWIRDVVFPSLRYAPVVVVDITGRVRTGRVSSFWAVGSAPAITSGDVRSLSEATLTLFCRSHADRDAVLYAMSSGNPCLMRVPSACRAVVDEMTFTPRDISEARYGIDGACLLMVDLVEVALSEVGAFQPIDYGTQTSNAYAASTLYGSLTPVPTGLSLAFLGRTYRDLYLSPTGIAP